MEMNNKAGRSNRFSRHVSADPVKLVGLALAVDPGFGFPVSDYYRELHLSLLGVSRILCGSCAGLARSISFLNEGGAPART